MTKAWREWPIPKKEQGLRAAKPDLKTRPVFHVKERPIQLPGLLDGIAVSKSIEPKSQHVTPGILVPM